MARGLLSVLLTALLGCGTASDDLKDDAGSSRDAGVDANDGGPRDGTPRDDSGLRRDAGTPRDAGPDSRDAGSPDAGLTDAGLETCSVASNPSICTDVRTCGGPAIFRDRCAGMPRRSCCFDDVEPCSVDGAPGLCLDVAVCPLTSTPGRCPGAAEIQCCTDPTEACDPSVHRPDNATLVETSWDAACPDGMISVTDFCIDKFEASLVELDSAGGELGAWSPYHSPTGVRVKAVALELAVPQGYISGVQAAAACAQAGKRLCTDGEWLSACRGPNEFLYPYGNTREPGRCNDSRTRHPAIEFFGTSDPWIWSEIQNACINQIPAALKLTSQHANCESAYGALDMMGNLHEWTADPTGTFRGGFYADTAINGEGCLYRTVAHSTGHWDYSTGFRCCASPR